MPTLDSTLLANRIVDAFVKHHLQPCTGAFVAEDGAWGCAVTALLLDAGVQPGDIALHAQRDNMRIWAAGVLGLSSRFLGGLINSFDGMPTGPTLTSTLPTSDYCAGLLAGERVLAELTAYGLPPVPQTSIPVPSVLDETTVAFG